MKKIYLDGSKMTSEFEFHEYILIKLGLPKSYGKNLDSLWDILTSKSEKIMVVLFNEESLRNHLGAYGENIIKLFMDIEKENPNIKFGMLG